MSHGTQGRIAGARFVSPSAERNKGPIAEILKQVLPEEGFVLEIGSGTGQHVVHFAREMPYLTWQPSERQDQELASIAHRISQEALANVCPALRLDVTQQPWPVTSAMAIVSLNMIHIAPWRTAEALIRNASSILLPGGMLCLYGPFRRGGKHTSPSNEAFDRQLRSQNPEWGVRGLEDVASLAAEHGFRAPDIHAMPANNLTVVFTRMN